MNNPMSCVGNKLVLMALMFAFLVCPWADRISSAVEPHDQRIEITIRDSTFLVTKTMPIHPGFPTVIVIRNEDKVRHGFMSSMLAGLSVHGEGEGIESYGKGIEGFYVGPGRTLTVRFITQHQGQFTFQCDLHSDLKGEIYLLEVPVA
ncbi:MAG: cupredoxin domain-containing protein [Nitrospira sp.]